MPEVYTGLYLNLNCEVFQNTAKVNEIFPSQSKRCDIKFECYLA